MCRYSARVMPCKDATSPQRLLILSHFATHSDTTLHVHHHGISVDGKGVRSLQRWPMHLLGLTTSGDYGPKFIQVHSSGLPFLGFTVLFSLVAMLQQPHARRTAAQPRAKTGTSTSTKHRQYEQSAAQSFFMYAYLNYNFRTHRGL